MAATLSAFSQAQAYSINPPRLRASSTGFRDMPRFSTSVRYKAVYFDRPLGLPYDSPTSIPAMAIPAAVNRSNIHFSASEGRPGSVGAYQTQGVASLVIECLGGIKNAGHRSTRNTSPGKGSVFGGAAAFARSELCSAARLPAAANDTMITNRRNQRRIDSFQGSGKIRDSAR